MKMKHLTKQASMLLMALLFAFSITACKDEEPDPEPAPTPDPEEELSSEASISAFTFSELDPEVAADINGTDITATVPHGTDVTALSPAITISEGAEVSPASGSAQDFTEPVSYTVTAEDGTTTSNYTVTVTVEEPEAEPVLVASTLWQRNLVEGGVPDWFVAHQDRDLAAHGEFVYIQNNKQNIRVVSAADGTDVSAGAAGYIDATQNFSAGALPVLGTATDSQGRIVASNLVVGSADEPFWNVYVWEGKDADQELLFQYPTPEGYRLGENLSVVGDVKGDAVVYVPGSGYGVANNEVLKFTITGGDVNAIPEIIALSGIEKLGNAPDAFPVSAASDANLLIAGTGVNGIAEYAQDGTLVGRLPEELNTGETAMLFTYALDVAAFEIQGRKVIATTATDFVNNTADAGYLYLIDYTDGWENVTADNVIRVPFTPEGNTEVNTNGTGGVDVVVNGDEATVYALITNFGIGAYNVTFQ